MNADLEFVEHMGQLFEGEGLTRIAGRIYGHLLLSEPPLSLDDLSVALQVSKGSASQDTRLLERLGVLERVTLPGDRRVYYRASSDGHDRILAVRQERMQQLRRTLDEGLRTEAAQTPAVRKRLKSSCKFYDHMIRTITEAQRVWLRTHGAKAREDQ